MTEYHVRRSRLSSSGSDDFEDESLDPRIQVELEKLNKASEEINRLELELDDARASFRQTLSESTHKLDVLAKKLGSCVEKARPYYDARLKAKDAHLETQRAALRFERACSMHEAAKEMVQLAEQGYMRRELPSDPAWQEMLNHATMKVNEAEKERNESEVEHQRTMNKFKVAEDQVQGLQKELKRAITKSKPYFEMKAKFNQVMEEHKHKVSVLEEDVSSTKSLYSSALRSLEAISDEIHRQRFERRQQQQLGVRGAGVGAECPLPPPAWEKGLSKDGKHRSMDPLGVVKIAALDSSGSQRRSRNLSGESFHEKDLVEEESRRAASTSPAVSSQDIAVGEKEEVREKDSETVTPSEEQSSEDREAVASASGKDANVNRRLSATTPEGKPVIMIPGDPLGVLPPTYTRASRTSPSSNSISHPAFSGGSPARSASQKSGVTHPYVSQAGTSHLKMPAGSRSKSASNPPEAFLPESVVYSNPEEARRQSYRQAVDASQKDAEDFELPENLDAPELDEVYMSLPRGEMKSREVKDAVDLSRQRSHSNPPDLKTRSPPHAIPGRMPAPVSEVLADGRKHGSAPEKSAYPSFSDNESHEGSPGSSSPSSARRTNKLQGLILRIDPTMDPLRNFEPGARNQAGQSSTSKTGPSHPANSASTSDPDANAEREPLTPTPTPTPTPCSTNQPFFKSKAEIILESKPEYVPTKSIIRSASMVSATGSERSETEFSEIESVSATQSPTKPRSRLLLVPSSADSIEDSSDTESLASTGPMLDDDQVEFLTMDFSDVNLDRDIGYSSTTLPPNLKRNTWSRMSLPPRLTYLDGFLNRAKRLSGEFDPQGPDFVESPSEEGYEHRFHSHSQSFEGVEEGEVVDGDNIEVAQDAGEVSKCQETQEGDTASEAKAETVSVRL
ncbi:nucleolar protein dao-5-like [Littorina saxatilis]|uniref:SH3 domain-binding protein 5-like n=1 Tax=Littorina saxatilis TaxID=31220 RepID=A0AAN9ASY4_9CAEN